MSGGWGGVSRSRRYLPELLALVALGGCGEALDEEEPPTPPTKAELSQIVATTRQPAYWLGPSFRQLTISATTIRPRAASFSYGPWTCDSGCTDSGGVDTSGRDTRWLVRIEIGGHIDPRKCWTRVGRAVAALLHCYPDGYPQELLVFTGSRQIYLTSLYTKDGQGEIAVREVMRALRPLNGHAPWPLPPPTRLSCREFRRIDGRYQRRMPGVIRPRTECGLGGRGRS